MGSRSPRRLVVRVLPPLPGESCNLVAPGNGGRYQEEKKSGLCTGNDGRCWIGHVDNIWTCTGDSGGPVYMPRRNYSAVAAGVVHGTGFPDNAPPSKRFGNYAPGNVLAQCGRYMTYSPIEDVFGDLGGVIIKDSRMVRRILNEWIDLTVSRWQH